MAICRTPQLVGNFSALRCIEAEEIEKLGQKKGTKKTRKEREPPKIYSPLLDGCK